MKHLIARVEKIQSDSANSPWVNESLRRRLEWWYKWVKPCKVRRLRICVRLRASPRAWKKENERMILLQVQVQVIRKINEKVLL